jgi:hypothetical protein
MKHVRATYARHICSDPGHLLKDFPEGLRNTPISIGQRCVVTIGDTSLGKDICEHISGPVQLITVHYLDAKGSLYHRYIGTFCLDFDENSEDLSQTQAIQYLRG